MSADPSADFVAPADGRRAWRLILAGTLVSALGSGLTLPFLLVYLHGVRHISLPVAGAIVAASGVAGLVLGMAGGSAGDRLGVGRVLVFGMAVSGLGTAALAAVRSPGAATLAVAASGVGQALIWPGLNSLIAAQLPPAERPRAYAMRFGVLNAGLGAGALISGSVVSLAHPASFELIYLIDAVTTLVFGLLIVAFLRNSAGFRRLAPQRDRAQAGEGFLPTSRGYRAVVADRRFLAYLVCMVLFILFGYAQLESPWAAFATGVVHAPPQIVGIGFAVNTGVIVVAQMGVARLTQRWRRSRMLLGVGTCWTIAWVITGLADWRPLSGAPADLALAVSLGVFALGETLLSPVNGALPNDLAPEHLRARYNALASTVWSVGVLIGPPIAGLLLGSAVPISWVAVIAAGTALAAGCGWSLSRFLPAGIDRPHTPESLSGVAVAG